MWGASTGFWGKVGDWALVAALILAALAALTSFASSFISSRVTSRVQSDSAKETARLSESTQQAIKGAAVANANAAKANADLAKANEQIAVAQAAAATANEHAAQLEIALEVERGKRARRRLSDEQIAILESELKSDKRTIYIVGSDDQEPQQYTDQFITLFRKHGRLASYILKTIWIDGPSLRLYVPLDGRKSAEEAEKDPLAAAFRRARLPISLQWGSDPGNPGFPEINNPSVARYEPGHPILFIGPKPLPAD